MFNKRGQELSTGTIILLILGVIILVLLAIGFTSGWGKILPFLDRSNVDSVKAQCSSACSIGGEYEFCKSPRELIPTRTADKIKDVTCYYLSKHFPVYGIDSCSIDCDSLIEILPAETTAKQTITQQELVDKIKKEVCPNFKGKMVQKLIIDSTKIQKLISVQCA